MKNNFLTIKFRQFSFIYHKRKLSEFNYQNIIVIL